MSWIKGAVLLLRLFFRSVPLGNRYYRNAHPAVKPAGIDDYLTALRASLREPGRMASAAKMGSGWPLQPRWAIVARSAGAQLPGIQCPSLATPPNG